MIRKPHSWKFGWKNMCIISLIIFLILSVATPCFVLFLTVEGSGTTISKTVTAEYSFGSPPSWYNGWEIPDITHGDFDDTDWLVDWASGDGIYYQVRSDESLDSTGGAWCCGAGEQGSLLWDEESRGWIVQFSNIDLEDDSFVGDCWSKPGFQFTDAYVSYRIKMYSDDFDDFNNYIYFNTYCGTDGIGYNHPLDAKSISYASDAPNDGVWTYGDGKCTDYWDPQYTGNNPSGSTISYTHYNLRDGTSISQWLNNNVMSTHKIAIAFRLDIKLFGSAGNDAEYFKVWIDDIKLNVNYEYNNQVPSQPTKVYYGPSAGYRHTQYTYKTYATDADGDDLIYEFDWGDGTTSATSTYTPSGSVVSLSHSWDEPATYYVKARAYDGYDWGPWSSTKAVTINNQLPDSPVKPYGGPSDAGYIYESYTYYTYATDADGDVLIYEFDWGDGTTSATSTYTPSGSVVSLSHSWDEPATYYVKARAYDGYDWGPWSSSKQVEIKGPPDTPSKPSGPNSGYIDVECDFEVETTDPDGDDVQYGMDWDDGSSIEWTGWFGSGNPCTMSHTWTEAGTYYIRVKARDIDLKESDWSTYKEVEIEVADPEVTEITCPSEIELGDTATIVVRGKNNGGQPDVGEISMSFPDLPRTSADDNNVTVHGSDTEETEIKWPDDEIGYNYGYDMVPAKYPLVIGRNAPWTSALGEEFLSVDFTPPTIGRQRVFFKMTAGAGSQWCGDPKEDGSESSARDQQSEYVWVREIQVVKPDLQISYGDIEFSNPNPAANERIRIDATVHNVGNKGVDNVKIDFYNGNPETGGELIGSNITSIQSHDNETVSISWNVEWPWQIIIPPQNSIWVVVDPSNEIEEIEDVIPSHHDNNSNNRAFWKLGVHNTPLHELMNAIEPIIYTTDIDDNLKRVFTHDETVVFHVIFRNPTTAGGDKKNRYTSGNVKISIYNWKGEEIKDFTKGGRRIAMPPNNITPFQDSWVAEDNASWSSCGFNFTGGKFKVSLESLDGDYHKDYGFYIDEFGVPEWQRDIRSVMVGESLREDVMPDETRGFDINNYNNLLDDVTKYGFNVINFCAEYYNYGTFEATQVPVFPEDFDIPILDEEKFIFGAWFPTAPSGYDYGGHYSTPPVDLIEEECDGDINKARENISQLVNKAHGRGLKVQAYTDIMGLYNPNTKGENLDEEDSPHPIAAKKRILREGNKYSIVAGDVSDVNSIFDNGIVLNPGGQAFEEAAAFYHFDIPNKNIDSLYLGAVYNVVCNKGPSVYIRDFHKEIWEEFDISGNEISFGSLSIISVIPTKNPENYIDDSGIVKIKVHVEGCNTTDLKSITLSYSRDPEGWIAKTGNGNLKRLTVQESYLKGNDLENLAVRPCFVGNASGGMTARNDNAFSPYLIQNALAIPPISDDEDRWRDDPSYLYYIVKQYNYLMQQYDFDLMFTDDIGRLIMKWQEPNVPTAPNLLRWFTHLTGPGQPTDSEIPLDTYRLENLLEELEDQGLNTDWLEDLLEELEDQGLNTDWLEDLGFLFDELGPLYGVDYSSTANYLRKNQDTNKFEKASLSNMLKYLRRQIKYYGSDKSFQIQTYFGPASITPGWNSVLSTYDMDGNDQYLIHTDFFSKWATRSHNLSYKPIRTDLRRTLDVGFTPFLVDDWLMASVVGISFANHVRGEPDIKMVKNNETTAELFNMSKAIEEDVDKPYKNVFKHEESQDLIYHSHLPDTDEFAMNRKSAEINFTKDEPQFSWEPNPDPYFTLYRIPNEWGEKARVLHVINQRNLDKIAQKIQTEWSYIFNIRIPDGERVDETKVWALSPHNEPGNNYADPLKEGDDYSIEHTKHGEYINISVENLRTYRIYYIGFELDEYITLGESYEIDPAVNIIKKIPDGRIQSNERIILPTLHDEEYISTNLTTTPQCDFLDVMLFWNNTNRSDIDLHLYSPAGEHIGWNYTTDTIDYIADSTYDYMSSLESIRVESPTVGKWTLKVYGAHIPSEFQTTGLGFKIEISKIGEYVPSLTTIMENISNITLGEQFHLPIIIENNGEGTAYNSTVRLSSPSINFTDETIRYEKLPVNTTVKSNIRSTPVQAGETIIYLNVTYEDGSSNVFYANRSQTITIKTRPRLCVSQSYHPILFLTEQDNITFSTNITNSGSGKAHEVLINNTLTNNNVNITLINTSIAVIEVGDTIDIIVNKTLSPGNWTSDINITYRNSTGSTFHLCVKLFTLHISPQTTSLDIDLDAVKEYANDTNFDGIYDTYIDPNNNTIVTDKQDFNNDSCQDFMIDINGDLIPDVFYDPTNSFYTTIAHEYIRYETHLQYLLFTDKNYFLDIFYDPALNITTELEICSRKNNTYYIDLNGDGSYDLIYNPDTNEKQWLESGLPNTIHILSGTKGNQEWYISNVSIILDACDNLSGLNHTFYKLNEGAWTDYVKPLNVTGDGDYTLYYYSTDNAGNNEMVKSTNFKLDLNKPSTTMIVNGVEGYNNWYLSNISASLQAIDNASGINYTHYKINGGTWTDYIQPLDLSSEGYYNLSYYSADNAGHIEDEKKYLIKIDKTSPSNVSNLQCTSHLIGTWSRDNIINVSWEPAADALSGLFGYSIDWNHSENALPDESIDIGNITNISSPSLNEGADWYFHIRSVDNAGNWNDTNMYIGPFWIDGTPPVTQPTVYGTEGQNNWYTSSVNVTLDATDGGTGVNYTKYKLDSLDWENYTQKLPITDEKIHTLKYYAVDKIGNIEAVQTHEIKIDKTPPRISLSSPNGGEFYTGAIEIRWTGSDNIDANPHISIDYSNNNGGYWHDIVAGKANDGLYSWDAAGLEGTQFLIRTRIQDEAGWQDIDISDNVFTIDNSPPATTLSVGDPKANDGLWVAPSTPLSLSATDGLSGVADTWYRYKQEGGSWTTWAIYTGSFSLPYEGTFIIEYYSTDSVGNVEITNSEVHHVDETAPETTAVADGLLDPSGWYMSIVEVTLSAVDDGSGVKDTFYNIDDQGWHPYTGPFSLMQGGIHEVKYYSTDGVDNNEHIKSIEIKIEVDPPTTKPILGYHILGNRGWILSPVELTLQATDDGIGVDGTMYKLDQADWKPYTQKLLLWRPGRYTLQYYSIDLGGSVEESNTTTIKIDYSLPTTDISLDKDPKENGHYAGPVNVTLQPYDSVSGIRKTMVQVDYGQWQEYGAPFMISEVGEHVIRFYSSDNAGNREDTHWVSIVIDENTAPVTTCIINPRIPDSTNGWHTSPVTVSFKATDTHFRVNTTFYKLNNGRWREYEEPILIAADGDYMVSYYSVDTADNKETVKSTTISIDKTSPTISFQQPSGGHLYLFGREILPLKQTVFVGQATLSVDTVDNMAGIEQVEFYIDDELQETLTEEPFEFVWDEPAFWQYTIKAVAVDQAGNTAAVEQDIWMFNL